MVPVSLLHTKYRASSAPRLLYIALSLLSKYALSFLHAEENAFGSGSGFGSDFGVGVSGGVGLVRRKSELEGAPPWKRIVFPLLIPILVLLSGVFAGLTLGYMSLDETQLNVLSISGTPKQREYANKIKPIRKNGHLLLVTLLLANMIVNETLPVIADPVLGGGFQSVVVSTVLIVIFAEIIPQSLFTRHGLYLGAKMAWFTTILIYGLGVISWPVAKLLEFVLGRHHGIIYRRAELKELIAMHDSHEAHGGDLKTDTVTIIGATLDLQEKVVRQAMTPIDKVFMLSIDAKLDYDLMKKICQTGHSRVPVYEEVEVPIAAVPLGSGIPSSSVVSKEFPANGAVDGADAAKKNERMVKVKKIVGVLLVKHCVLLDPRDATPLRKIPLNKVPFVPNNEPLLGMLDKFQEGRSHMAIVSRYSVDKAQSVKKAVKRGLTQRLRARVGMGDTDSSSSSSSSDDDTDSGTSGLSYAKRWAGRKKQARRRRIINGFKKDHDVEEGNPETEDGATIDADGETLKEDRTPETVFSTPPSVGTGVDTVSGGGGIEMEGHRQEWSLPSGERKTKRTSKDNGVGGDDSGSGAGAENSGGKKKATFQLSALSKQAGAVMTGGLLEQSMPADAVLAKEGADEFLQSIDPAVMPLGIITLEDVLEELIGEEIYDEFDPQGAHGDPYAYDVAPPAGPNPSSLPPTHNTAAAGHAHTLDVKYPKEVTYKYNHATATSDIHAATAPNTPGAGNTTAGGGSGGVNAAATATGTNRPVLLPGIPIGIPMLRGFGFLTRRSKSAPPVPRNKQKPGPRQSETEGRVDDDADDEGGEKGEEEENEKEKEVEMTEVKKDASRGSDVNLGRVVTNPSAATPVVASPASPSLDVRSESTPVQEIRMPRPVRGMPVTTIQQLGMTNLIPSVTVTNSTGTSTALGPTGIANQAGSGTKSLSNSRSTSPAPSLEAILLERSRRRMARENISSSSPGNVGAGSVNVSGGHVGEGGLVRGKGFKSSPLAPASRSASGSSLVIAEKVKESLERERRDKEGREGKDSEKPSEGEV